MSTIVSPYPTLPERLPARDALWWRFRLQPNADGNLIIQRTNARGDDMSTGTWMSWEFFDRHDTILDAGLDRPTVDRARLIHSSHGTHWPMSLSFLDLLCVDRPTPSQYWISLTGPGDWTHPGDY